MGDGDTGLAALGEQAVPEGVLGAHVERARGVVEDDQVGAAGKHARGGSALDLAT